MDRNEALSFYEEDEDAGAVAAASAASTHAGLTTAPGGLRVDRADNVRLDDLVVGSGETPSIPAVRSSELSGRESGRPRVSTSMASRTVTSPGSPSRARR